MASVKRAEPEALPADASTVIGIDVGGRRKGFHAVALRQGAYAGQLASGDVQELSQWCRLQMRAQLIAIDAPSRWSADDRARPCERELNALGIRCFASPTRAVALAHPSDYYGWMLQGEALYAALEPSHPLLLGLPPSGPACFETFPHAITWMLLGGQARAAEKSRQRRTLLQRFGIDTTPLTSIDRIDAALCALAAHQVGIGGDCQVCGEAESGLIVVPHSLSNAAAQLPRRSQLLKDAASQGTLSIRSAYCDLASGAVTLL